MSASGGTGNAEANALKFLALARMQRRGDISVLYTFRTPPSVQATPHSKGQRWEDQALGEGRGAGGKIAIFHFRGLELTILRQGRE